MYGASTTTYWYMELKIPGVLVTSAISVTPHVDEIIRNCAYSMYALPTIVYV